MLEPEIVEETAIAVRTAPAPLTRRDASKDSIELMHRWLSTKSELTVDSYKRAISDFAAFLGTTEGEAVQALIFVEGGAGAAAEMMRDYKAHMQRRPVWRSAKARRDGHPPVRMGLSPSAINQRLGALCSLANVARTFGKIGWELPVEWEEPSAYRDTRGISEEDLGKVLQALSARISDGTLEDAERKRAARDRAIVACMYGHALRRIETVALQYPEDVDFEGKRLWILEKRHRRNRTQRVQIPFSSFAVPAVKEWLQWRGTEPGPLFTSLAQQSAGGMISLRGFSNIIEKIAKDSGVPKIRTHQFRHSAITKIGDVTNGNLRAMQAFSRHRKTDTVLLYDDKRRDASGEATEQLSQSLDELVGTKRKKGRKR